MMGLVDLKSLGSAQDYSKILKKSEISSVTNGDFLRVSLRFFLYYFGNIPLKDDSEISMLA